MTQDYLFSQGATIGSNNKWMKVCSSAQWGMPSLPLLQGTHKQYPFVSAMCGALVAALFMAMVLAIDLLKFQFDVTDLNSGTGL